MGFSRQEYWSQLSFPFPGDLPDPGIKTGSLELQADSLPSERTGGDIRDVGLIPGSGRCPGEGNGYLLQYFCLENPMDTGAWWAAVHRSHKESDMTEAT